MQQAKFSCKEDQVEFLNNYKDYGFMVYEAGHGCGS